MSLLDIDINNHDILLNTLAEIFLDRKVMPGSGWCKNKQEFNFKLDFKYDINRIKKPELYYIYYDFETFKPGTIYDDEGRLTVVFYIFKKYDYERENYRMLDSYNQLTLKKVYESIR